MTHVRTWILDVVAIIPFASFAWALRGHFVCAGPMPPATRLLAGFSALSLGSYVARLATRSPQPGLLFCVLGTFLFAAATGLFWWSITTTSTAGLGLAYARDSNGTVVSSGPFRLVRHPFYASYMMFWAGTALIAGGWQWLPALMLMAWYASIAIAEERRFLRGGIAAHYAVYRRGTGMFVPSVWRQRP